MVENGKLWFCKVIFNLVDLLFFVFEIIIIFKGGGVIGWWIMYNFFVLWNIGNEIIL